MEQQGGSKNQKVVRIPWKHSTSGQIMTTRMEQAERLTTSISATQPLASPGRQVRIGDVLITFAYSNCNQRTKDKRHTNIETSNKQTYTRPQVSRLYKFCQTPGLAMVVICVDDASQGNKQTEIRKQTNTLYRQTQMLKMNRMDHLEHRQTR